MFTTDAEDLDPAGSAAWSGKGGGGRSTTFEASELSLNTGGGGMLEAKRPVGDGTGGSPIELLSFKVCEGSLPISFSTAFGGWAPS